MPDFKSNQSKKTGVFPPKYKPPTMPKRTEKEHLASKAKRAKCGIYYGG